MKPARPRVHLRALRGAPACCGASPGRRKVRGPVVIDVGRVTCGNCRRTVFYGELLEAVAEYRAARAARAHDRQAAAFHKMADAAARRAAARK